MLLQLYRDLVTETDPDDLTLMGDSAGGGLALALAQELRNKRLPQPARVLLLSPWLDVTMTNSDIAQLDRRDPMVSVPGCIAAGRMYAGGLDPCDPRISPLNGDLRGLAPITLFIGTRDVLVSDCRKLRARAPVEGVPLDYHESEGMLHDWMLLELPESEPALEQIIALVREQGREGASHPPGHPVTRRGWRRLTAPGADRGWMHRVRRRPHDGAPRTAT